MLDSYKTFYIDNYFDHQAERAQRAKRLVNLIRLEPEKFYILRLKIKIQSILEFLGAKSAKNGKHN